MGLNYCAFSVMYRKFTIIYAKSNTTVGLVVLQEVKIKSGLLDSCNIITVS